MSMQFTTRSRRNVKEMKQIITDFSRLKDLPMLGNFLTLIACHTDKEIKFNTIKNNLRYLTFSGNKIVIINSSDCEYNSQLKKYVEDSYPHVTYVTYKNNSELDMGKWMRYLKDYYRGQLYNYIIFTNDSYYLHSNINHFYNGALQSMKDLYAFTSSSQIHYHFQSYLFAIQSSMVRKFMNHYTRVKHRLTDYMSVVGNVELQLYKLYRPSCAAVLNLGTFPGNTGRNVFFNNDHLYMELREMGILPITKIKRLEQDKVAINNSKISPHAMINSGFNHSTSFNSVTPTPSMAVMKAKERTPIKRGVLPTNMTGLLEDRAINRF